MCSITNIHETEFLLENSVSVLHNYQIVDFLSLRYMSDLHRS